MFFPYYFQHIHVIIFKLFVKEAKRVELGMQLSYGKKIGGMLFADDFVGGSDSK